MQLLLQFIACGIVATGAFAFAHACYWLWWFWRSPGVMGEAIRYGMVSQVTWSLTTMILAAPAAYSSVLGLSFNEYGHLSFHWAGLARTMSFCCSILSSAKYASAVRTTLLDTGECRCGTCARCREGRS